MGHIKINLELQLNDIIRDELDYCPTYFEGVDRGGGGGGTGVESAESGVEGRNRGWRGGKRG